MEDHFYLARLDNMTYEIYGTPVRQEIEDYFVNKLAQIELDRREEEIGEILDNWKGVCI